MKTMTAPIHATDDVMCVVYVNLPRAGLIVIAENPSWRACRGQRARPSEIILDWRH
jgi:hypothetical protein